MNTTYPLQICAVKRKEKTLGIDAKLYPPSEKDSAAPMEMHNGFSRFELTLIENGLFVSANIPAREVRYIKKQTDIALELLLTSNIEQDTEPTKKMSPGYTVTLKSNNAVLKGKTPANVLLNNAGDKVLLVQAREWLEANLTNKAFAKSNQQQIDAINDALDLFDMGTLCSEKSEVSVASKPLMLYASPQKFKSQKQEGTDKHLIYSINLVCDTAKTYPFAINIMNGYAPVVDGTNGQKIIKASNMDNVTNMSIMMSAPEWYNAITRMEATLNMFEQKNFLDAYNEAQKNSYKHE